MEINKKRKLGAETCVSKEYVCELKRQNVNTASSQSFDWSKLCFICKNPENKKKKKLLSKVQKNPEEVKAKVLSAAKIRKDVILVNLLGSNSLNLSDVDACYHKLCYQNYTNERSLESFKTERDAKSSLYYETAIKKSVENYKQRFDQGELILFPDLCRDIKQCLANELQLDGDELLSIRSNFIKQKVQQIYADDLTFYSHQGKPDIVCSSNISIAALLHELLQKRNSEKSNDNNQDPSYTLSCQNEDIVLHNAVGILKSSISNIPRTSEYFHYSEVSLKHSKQFVPPNVAKFLLWLINDASFNEASNPNDPNIDLDILRKAITLSECIIYCSRSGQNKVVPPFHQGLMIQLHHAYGSRMIIDVLNSHGLCSTYDDLRNFLTVAAENELEKCSQVFVPSGLIPKRDGGKLIHEGDDNIDINTQTINGKNTYHVMGRVVFQNQSLNIERDVSRIARNYEKRSISVKERFSDVIPFKQPTKKPNPCKVPKAFETVGQALEQHDGTPFYTIDVAWALTRAASRGSLFTQKNDTQSVGQLVPNWVAFNTKFDSVKGDVTVPLYLPSINAQPSDPSTVYTTLRRGKELSEKCGQSYHSHTFDQQLYAIAQTVKYSCKDELSNCIIRLGGFHFLCTFISCLNIIWGDCGLQDMLTESGLYARNTVQHMMEGKQFHRAVRAIILCYEVFLNLMLENFFEWLHMYRPDYNLDLSEYDKFVSEIQRGNYSRELLKHLSERTKDMLVVFNEFRTIMRGKSKTFRFWDDFLISAQLLLEYIRAERECNWEKHLTTACAMLPYFFACDKPNYSRWGTLYYVEMSLLLPNEVREEFLKGEFSIRFSPGPFRGLWSDMGVEMSVVRDSKGSSGIIGLTRKDSTILRWTVTRNLLGQYSKTMSERSGKHVFDYTAENHVHEGEMLINIKRDEEDFMKLINHVKLYMSDPFSPNIREDVLINISSGLIATADVSNSLLSSIETGKKKLLQFVKECFEMDSASSKGFYEPIKQTKLQTFKKLIKPSEVRVNGKVAKQNVSAESVYQRALYVTSNRQDIDLEKILSLPLTSIPLALFKPDGCRRITKKSELMHILEGELQGNVTNEFPNHDETPIIVVDAMAELQAFNSSHFKTFNDLGKQMQNVIAKKLKSASEVHLVFDRYDSSTPNPKDEERNRRYGTGGNVIDIKGERPLNDLKKVLNNNENKNKLTLFLCEHIENNIWNQLTGIDYDRKKIFISGGLVPRDMTFEIRKDEKILHEAFSCEHHDADTRIVFQVMKIDSTTPIDHPIIVESPDTDIFVLLLRHHKNLQEGRQIWFHTGKTSALVDHRRYVPVHILAKKLGPTLTSAIVPLHALSGCDTTSSIFSVGKKKIYTAFKTLSLKEQQDFADFCKLQLEDQLKLVNVLLAAVYDPKNKLKTNRQSISTLRFKMALEKQAPVEKLPPSEPALRQHVLRSLWQINDWENAITAKPVPLNFEDHGWLITENGKLTPNYFDGSNALEYLQTFFCKCNRRNACSSDLCPCVSLNLDCCSICKCTENCCNRRNACGEEDIK